MSKVWRLLTCTSKRPPRMSSWLLYKLKRPPSPVHGPCSVITTHSVRNLTIGLILSTFSRIGESYWFHYLTDQPFPPSVPAKSGSTCLLPVSWNEATSSLIPVSSTPFSRLLSKGWKMKRWPHLPSCLKHSGGRRGSKNKAQPLWVTPPWLPAL